MSISSVSAMDKDSNSAESVISLFQKFTELWISSVQIAPLMIFVLLIALSVTGSTFMAYIIFLLKFSSAIILYSLFSKASTHRVSLKDTEKEVLNSKIRLSQIGSILGVLCVITVMGILWVSFLNNPETAEILSESAISNIKMVAQLTVVSDIVLTTLFCIFLSNRKRN